MSELLGLDICCGTSNTRSQVSSDRKFKIVATLYLTYLVRSFIDIFGHLHITAKADISRLTG